MRKLVGGRILIPFLVLTALYWAAVWYFPRSSIADLVNGMKMSFSVSVMLAYGAACWAALKMPKDKFGRVHHILLGIFVAWFVTLAVSIWAFVFTNLGQPQWMILHPLLYYFHFLMCLGAVLHLSAPQEFEQVNVLGFSKSASRFVLVAAIAGAIVGFILMKWFHV